MLVKCLFRYMYLRISSMQGVKSLGFVDEVTQFCRFLLTSTRCLVLLHFDVMIFLLDKKCPWLTCHRSACILGCRGTYTGSTSFREHPREKGEIFSPFQPAVPQTPWNLTCAMELRHWFTAPICFSKHSAIIHFFFNILASNIFPLRLWEIIL